ncbi:porin [Comamonas sp. GB3 AK4-5]|uniref:porin n=1 Tax=Comamonas sp. GB3 AK4-5 TaxID=3231487 RepID=UPI00351F2799
MKIQRVMLAVLALCGTSAALAQSSVTIYGRVNTTIESQKYSDSKSMTGMFNNASRIGFKGVEDLGNGLKAGFVLEAGFGSDDGSGPLTFGRQSEVNLSGNFGMVRLGNFFPESYYASADYVSLHNHDTGSSADALYVDPVWMGAGSASQYRAGGLNTGNKLAYRTPTFGGFSAEGSVSMHERAANTNNKYGYDLAANYNQGPLALGAGYSQWDGNKQGSLRGLYTFGQVTLGAYYQRNDENLLGSRNNFRLSGMYALGASEFHVNVGRANAWSKLDDSAATQWTLGYNYNLSKRTKVYTYYTKINNKANASYGYAVGATNPAGQDFRSFAVGIRHNF